MAQKNVVYCGAIQTSVSSSGDYDIDLSFYRAASATRIVVSAGTIDTIAIGIDELDAVTTNPALTRQSYQVVCNPQTGSIDFELPFVPKVIRVKNSPIYIGADYTDAPGTVIVMVYE